jgi:hypothetical protein
MRIIHRVVLFAALIALLAVCALGIYSRELKQRADYVVRTSYELSQRDNPPTVEEVRQRFRSNLNQPNPCTSDGCGYDFVISNRVLAALHLVPYTALRSEFWAKNEVMQSNDLVLWGPSYVVDIQVSKKCSLFLVVPGDDSSHAVVSGSIGVDSGATTGTKRTALGINTGCLTKLQGCSSIAEALPTVWEQTPERTLHCRIPNRDGIFETTDPR